MSYQLPEFQYKISLGQNFIFDARLLHHLVDQTALDQNDTVLEIGAGRGDLTEVLADRCKQVVTMEIDPRLEPVLSSRFVSRANVRVIMEDVMNADLVELMEEYGRFHVVANLPYYLTTPILNLLFHLVLPIASINVMVQQEAAQRVLAQAGTSEYGPLAVLAAYKGFPRETVLVPAAMFTPPPKVDSVFLVIPLHEVPPVKASNEPLFYQVVSAAFVMRRKTLANNLMRAFSLQRDQALSCIQSAGLPALIRGERLTLPEFASLSNQIQGFLNNQQKEINS